MRRRKKKKKVAKTTHSRRSNSWQESLRLMSCACTGCHVVDVNAPWILGSEVGMTLPEDAPAELLTAAAVLETDSTAEDAGMYDHYLVQLDIVHERGMSEDATLFALNISAVERVCYISATQSSDDEPVRFFDRHGKCLAVGVSSAPEVEYLDVDNTAETNSEVQELQDRLDEAARALHSTSAEAFHTAGTDDMEMSEDSEGAALPSSIAAPVPLIPCTTFICIIPPHTALRIARVRGSPDLAKLTFPLSRHSDMDGTNQPVTPCFSQFPLGRVKETIPGDASVGMSSRDYASPAVQPLAFLCTQGFGGRLTHFFPESYHAIDLRCPSGTPILAVSDGTVREVLDKESLTGVHCDNLRKWNSIALDIIVEQTPYIVEYLHIMPGSAQVSVGDRVEAGDVLCLSGNVGFAPEPHVHIEVHLGEDPGGCSVRFEFESTIGSKAVSSSSTTSSSAGGGDAECGCRFVPVAGQWCGPTGLIGTDYAAMD